MSTDYQTAIAYSHNFATAKPDILPTEKEHILGLCQTLESVGEDRDRFIRIFAQACETLGAVQEALGEESSVETTGFEPQLVKKIKEERDALAAHVERMKHLLDGVIESDLNGAHEWDAAVAKWLKEAPETSLDHLKAQWQAEALEEVADYEEKVGVDYFYGFLNGRAQKIRRQAEGGEA